MYNLEKILIIADNRFPLSYAATTRIYMLCKLFQSLSFQTEVFIINVHEDRKFDLKEEHINCRWFANESRSPGCYLKVNDRVVNIIKNSGKNLKYVVLYQEVLLQTYPIIRLAKKKNFKVLAYFDEWYEWEKAHGKAFWMTFMMNVSIRLSEYVVAPFFKNKIVISRGLKRFYRKSNCFLLPTIVDLKDKIWDRDEFIPKEKIIITYAGWPGGRDDLRMLVEAVDELTSDDKQRIQLRIFTYATTEKDLQNHIPNLKQIRQRNCGIIDFCGEVTREQAIEEIKKSDFSYLLREDKWTNNAGFSTKIGESLAVGTPMFVNCTSDIGYYIKDGKNGILICDMSKEAVCEGLRRILNLTKEERAQLRKNAYKTAERYFDYRQYKGRLKRFLDEI